MELDPERKMNLDTVPNDVLREVVSYLDVGHIISVAQVNRVLRNALINNRWLWLSRLQDGLKLWVAVEERQDPFREIVRHVSTRRCSDCLEMETGQRPFIDIFFKKTLCQKCKKRSKYALINAGTAKRNYFLNEKDLVPLKTMSMENPHYKSASPVRLYSREQICKVSDEKMRSQGIDRHERLQQQQDRRVRATEARARAMRHRKEELLRSLTAHGLMYYVGCRTAGSFIRGGWRNKRERIRWRVEDIVAHFQEEHEIEVIEVIEVE